MHLDTENMIQIRCAKCNRLLYVVNNGSKKIRTSDKIEYSINGTIEILCKCGTKNN